MPVANVSWPDSLWAAMTPPGPDLPELVGTAEADVIVIGGGFTGLSTALHLREAGVDVAIVEAMEPGWVQPQRGVIADRNDELPFNGNAGVPRLSVLCLDS